VHPTLYGRSCLQNMVCHLRVHHRYSRNIENHHFSLLVHNLDEHGFHDLMGALSIHRADDRQQQDAIMNLYDRRRKFANRSWWRVMVSR
jgi:hypothetical protein